MERDHHRRPLQRQLAGHTGLGETSYFGRGATSVGGEPASEIALEEQSRFFKLVSQLNRLIFWTVRSAGIAKNAAIIRLEYSHP
jgi:hypothetical protein